MKQGCERKTRYTKRTLDDISKSSSSTQPVNKQNLNPILTKAQFTLQNWQEKVKEDFPWLVSKNQFHIKPCELHSVGLQLYEKILKKDKASFDAHSLLQTLKGRKSSIDINAVTQEEKQLLYSFSALYGNQHVYLTLCQKDHTFVLAAKIGDIKFIEQYILKRILDDALNKDALNKALLAAVQYNQFLVVKLFLKSPITHLFNDSILSRAIKIASKKGFVEILSHILVIKILPLEDQYDSLVLAVEKNQLKIVKYLLSKLDKEQQNIAYKENVSLALIKASENKYVEIEKYISLLLCKNKKNIIFKYALNVRNKLLVQICLRHLTEMQIQNAFMDIISENKENALLVAVEYQLWSQVIFIFKNYADIAIDIKIKAIQRAAKSEKNEIVKQLIKEIAHLDIENISKIFRSAAQERYWFIIKMILYCCPKIKNDDKSDALNIAIKDADLHAVKMLVYEGGMNIYQLQWALHHAQIASQSEILQFLQSVVIKTNLRCGF